MSRHRGVFFLLGVLLLMTGVDQVYAQRSADLQDRARQFDYYLLSLSWSPEYCAGSPGGGSSQQCGGGRQFGFVVHGLWPQYNRGYPQFCRNTSRVDDNLVEKLLPIMPSEQLIRHEWKKHGTCSGLTTGQYFEAVLLFQIAKATATSEYNVPDPRKKTKSHQVIENNTEITR